MREELAAALVDLRKDEVLQMVRDRANKGENPIQILEECRRGLTVVGDRFKEGDFFLAEMMLAAEIFKGAMSILNPCMEKARPPEPLGKVVVATLKGDIHDLGKNIMATLLQAQGFQVHDLGVDVPPEAVLQKVTEVNPQFVGFSALITSAFAAMKEANDLFVESGIRDRFKLLIGGGVTTPMLREHIGADFQTLDAVEGVDYCLGETGRRGNG